ncbi:MAG: SGNH/GDSL hydrolase family protein [Akkermansia sp.]
MKRLLLPLCAICLLVRPCSTAADMGKVMYIGDSITHGVNSASYRWEMHKILVDNGITYREIGINTGNTPGALGGSALRNVTAAYAGVTFRNVHSAQSGGRAWELSGNASGTKPAGQDYRRYGGSRIANWLDQDDKDNKGEPYRGERFVGDRAPDRFFLMIGTNDLLSDTKRGASLPANKKAEQDGLLKDIEAIYRTMKKGAPKAAISVNLIPAWCMGGTAADPEAHRAVAEFNEMLRCWAKSHPDVCLIDVNQGLSDVSAADPLVGEPAFFGADRLHPNAQGDRLIAANMARTLGFGGRSAGLPRRAAADLRQGAKPENIALKAGESRVLMQGLGAAFTLELTPRCGNGATDGWDKQSTLDICLGAGNTLSLSESSISWNGMPLYSRDLSTNKEPLRLCALPDSAARAGGLYLWLGARLIGEALPRVGTTTDISATVRGSFSADLRLNAAVPDEAYAPPLFRKKLNRHIRRAR